MSTAIFCHNPLMHIWMRLKVRHTNYVQLDEHSTGQGVNFHHIHLILHSLVICKETTLAFRRASSKAFHCCKKVDELRLELSLLSLELYAIDRADKSTRFSNLFTWAYSSPNKKLIAANWQHANWQHGGQFISYCFSIISLILFWCCCICYICTNPIINK